MPVQPGTEVLIKWGPFAGQKADVISASAKRIIVGMALSDRRVVVELDKEMIDVLARTNSQERTA
jgi:hypothetical protein